MYNKKYGFHNVNKVSRACYYVGLGAGILAVAFKIFFSLLNISIEQMVPPCSFYTLTGYYCPGCGGTRAVIALLQGRFFLSLYYHPFVPYMASYYVLYEISHTLDLITHGKVRGMRFCPSYFYIGIALILLQWVGKNYFKYRYGFLL